MLCIDENDIEKITYFLVEYKKEEVKPKKKEEDNSKGVFEDEK